MHKSDVQVGCTGRIHRPDAQVCRTSQIHRATKLDAQAGFKGWMHRLDAQVRCTGSDAQGQMHRVGRTSRTHKSEPQVRHTRWDAQVGRTRLDV